jgi:sulfite exporter TauE/SafE
MSLIPEISNPFIGAFAAGLVYGLAFCTAWCLPFVASYIAGVGAGFSRGVKLTMIFSVGRIAAYALIGALAGLLSGLLWVTSEAAISPFQAYSSLAFGVVTIIIGAIILFKSRKPCDCNAKDSEKILATAKKAGLSRFGVGFGAFTLGLTRGLILCPPLLLVLAYAVPFSDPLGSVGLAVVFGLGTAISPILLLGGVTGWLLNKAPLLRRWISVGGAAILITLGVMTVLSSVV